jgi:sulfate transport system ATP-binding protein
MDRAFRASLRGGGFCFTYNPIVDKTWVSRFRDVSSASEPKLPRQLAARRRSHVWDESGHQHWTPYPSMARYAPVSFRHWQASLFDRFFGGKQVSSQPSPARSKKATQAPARSSKESFTPEERNDDGLVPRARAKQVRRESTEATHVIDSADRGGHFSSFEPEICIAIRHVHKIFEDSHAPEGQFYALRDIVLDIEDGSLVALVGPSGSGKSTLLRCIAGLETPTSGRIFLQGRDTTEMTIQERRIGFVFQHYALWKHMTVWKNVAFGLEIRKVPRPRIDHRVRELLELMGLEGLGDRYPHQLSGGQRQRVALARALAPEPRVLLLDEPFGALDARVRRGLRAWLRRLHDEVGTTTIFVTHDQQEALEVASSVVVMNKGRIEQVGSPLEIYEHPASPFVMSFMGDVSVVSRDALPAEQANGRTFRTSQKARSVDASSTDSLWREPDEPPTVPRGLGSPTGSRASDNASQYLMLRPHDVHLHRTPDGTTIPARVVDVFFLGWSVRVDVELEDGQMLQSVMLTTRYKELGDLYAGDLVHVKFFGERSFEVDEAEYNI